MLRYGDLGASGAALFWGDLDAVENYFVLTVQDSAHGHAAAAASLTQAHLLAMGDAAHGQAADGDLDLTQTEYLVVGESAHAHSAAGDFVLPAHPLAIADAGHRVRTLPFGLFQGAPLPVDYAYHEHHANGLVVIHGQTVTYRVVADWDDPTVYGPDDNPYYELRYRIDNDDNYIYTLSYLPAPSAVFSLNARADQRLEISVRTVNGGLVTLWTTWQVVELTTVNYVVIAQDAKHDQAADGTIRLSEATFLTLADTRHDLTGDELTMVLWWQLALADTRHGQTAPNLGVIQAHNLVLEDTAHGQTAGAPVLSIESTLSLVRDARHDHGADNPGLTQANSLALIDSAFHWHVVEEPAPRQAQVLAAIDALHDQPAAGDLLLTQAYGLVPVGALHAQAADNPTLSQLGIFPESARLDHTVEEVVLVQANTLVVRETMHAQGVESVFLAAGFTLSVAGTDHPHAAMATVITQGNRLAILDTLHAHGIDTLDLETELTLLVAPAWHAHLAGATVEQSPTPGSRIFLVRAEDRIFVILP